MFKFIKRKVIVKKENKYEKEYYCPKCKNKLDGLSQKKCVMCGQNLKWDV